MKVQYLAYNLMKMGSFLNVMIEVPIIKKPVTANQWTGFYDRDFRHEKDKKIF